VPPDQATFEASQFIGQLQQHIAMAGERRGSPRSSSRNFTNLIGSDSRSSARLRRINGLPGRSAAVVADALGLHAVQLDNAQR
jgi:hypothetical protein